MADTLEGTVTFFPAAADATGPVEFDLRLDNGQSQRIRTDARLRVGDEVVVSGSLDPNAVLVAETIAPRRRPVAPARLSWLWVPPIALFAFAVSLWVYAQGFNSSMAWLAVAFVIASYALIRRASRRRRVLFSIAGGVLLTAMAAVAASGASFEVAMTVVAVAGLLIVLSIGGAIVGLRRLLRRRRTPAA